jgi:hypothetical protein
MTNRVFATMKSPDDILAHHHNICFSVTPALLHPLSYGAAHTTRRRRQADATTSTGGGSDRQRQRPVCPASGGSDRRSSRAGWQGLPSVASTGLGALVDGGRGCLAMAWDPRHGWTGQGDCHAEDGGEGCLAMASDPGHESTRQGDGRAEDGGWQWRLRTWAPIVEEGDGLAASQIR